MYMSLLGLKRVLEYSDSDRRWMDERCFRPLLCTVKAELGRGQPGLMRWIWDETLPQSSIDRSTLHSAAHRATKWASGRPRTRIDVRRVPGITGLPGYLDGRKLCCKVACVIILKLTSRPSLSLLLCSTYLQYFGPTYFIEYARTYVFLHGFTYEIHEKRTRWQPCEY